MIGIYSIENIVNGCRYIGQSIHIETREYEHFNALERGVHFNQHLQNAFDSYGRNCFRFSVLEECDTSELSSREIYWMNQYGGYQSDSLYNLVEGGRNTSGENNPNYGKHWSPEWKSAQSARMKSYFADPTNHPMYGKKHSEESKIRMSKAQQGKTQTQESKKKKSETMKRHFQEGLVSPMLGKHHSEKTKAILRAKSSTYRHSEEAKSKISEKVSGQKNGMYGKHHTEEMRRQLSVSHTGANNYMYGKVRITDGFINKAWPRDETLPEGFRLRMKPRNKESKGEKR